LECIAFIGLGANLEAPVDRVREAIVRLDRVPGVKVVRVSPLYASKPVGPRDQPDYVNAAAEIATSLDPESLLLALKQIESAMGRVTTVRWGPRLIDLDVLLYEDRVVDRPSLQIPHKEIANRRFVLKPLFDLAPDRVVPGRGTVRALLDALEGDDDVVPIDARQ
jgi:2-amino-4-hydroxy-6-hydroxymethyldihydropteridine diphosphokinase